MRSAPRPRAWLRPGLAAAARAAGSLLLLALVAGCGSGHAQAAHGGGQPQDITDGQAPEVVLAELPPMGEGQFPCSDCHEPDLPVKTARRRLNKAHQEIRLVHGGESMWCWDCHDVEQRDQLRAAGETLVPYEQSHIACGKCHGRELQDWHGGAHGTRSGSWSGRRTAQRCAHCHDAHAPAFEPIAPMPPPARPRRSR